MSKTFNDNILKYLLNKIKTAFFQKSEAQTVSTISVESTPTSGSNNLVTSGGVYTALSGKVAINQPTATVGDFLVIDSNHNVTTQTIPNANGVSF